MYFKWTLPQSIMFVKATAVFDLVTDDDMGSRRCRYLLPLCPPDHDSGVGATRYDKGEVFKLDTNKSTASCNQWLSLVIWLQF